NVDTLVKQISLRGRDFEQGIQREYLEQLNTHYENWTQNYKLGPLLTVESDSLDFVSRKKDLEKIVGMIKKRLKM
ncbi:MAG: deoxynucleoside kinase, partial [Bacteroidota bacterium]